MKAIMYGDWLFAEIGYEEHVGIMIRLIKDGVFTEDEANAALEGGYLAFGYTDGNGDFADLYRWYDRTDIGYAARVARGIYG